MKRVFAELIQVFWQGNWRMQLVSKYWLTVAFSSGLVMKKTIQVNLFSGAKEKVGFILDTPYQYHFLKQIQVYWKYSDIFTSTQLYISQNRGAHCQGEMNSTHSCQANHPVHCPCTAGQCHLECGQWKKHYKSGFRNCYKTKWWKSSDKDLIWKYILDSITYRTVFLNWDNCWS